MGLSTAARRQAGWVPHRRTGCESHTGASPGAREDCMKRAPELAVRLPPVPAGLLVPHLHPRVPGGHPHPGWGLQGQGDFYHFIRDRVSLDCFGLAPRPAGVGSATLSVSDY